MTQSNTQTNAIMLQSINQIEKDIKTNWTVFNFLKNLKTYDIKHNEKIDIQKFLEYLNKAKTKAVKKYNNYLSLISETIFNHTLNKDTTLKIYNSETDKLEDFGEGEAEESEEEIEENFDDMGYGEIEEKPLEKVEVIIKKIAEKEETEIEKMERIIREDEELERKMMESRKKKMKEMKQKLDQLKNPPPKPIKQQIKEILDSENGLNCSDNYNKFYELLDQLIEPKLEKKVTPKTGKKVGEIKDKERNKRFAERLAHLDYVCPYDNFLRKNKSSFITHIECGNGGCKRFKMVENGEELDAEKEKIIADVKNCDGGIRTEKNYSNYRCKTEADNKLQTEIRIKDCEKRQKNK